MQLFHALVYDGLRADVLHAERTAAQREATVSKFRTGQVWVLIATELVARGMDFKGVSLVINYDFPQTTTSYIHRIGRTGRAGRAGQAVTFFTEADVEQLRSIANVMKASGCPVADWMLKLKPMAKDERRRRAVAPIARKPTAAAGAVSGGGMSWFLVYTVACLHAHACIQSHTVACLPRHHLQSLSAGALPGARHLAAYNHPSPASMA